MNSGLRVRIALHTDGLPRTFTRAGVGLSSLSPNGESAQVTNAAIAFDALKPLQVEADLTTQVALDHVLAILDGMNDLRQLLFGEIFGPNARVNPRTLQDLHRIGRTYPVNVPKRDVDPLVIWNVNSENSCHNLAFYRLTLPLLVPGIRADHSNHALAANYLTVLAEPLYRCSNFHIQKLPIAFPSRAVIEFTAGTFCKPI